MLPGKEESVAKSTTIAVDLAKSVFEVAVSERPGRVSSRHRLSRAQLLRFFARRTASTVLLETLARENALAVRLRSVPGIGLLTATALAGFVGDLRRFPSARRFASYLGLTPRERSSGAVRRLGAISKRGDRYLRMLLIHGARAVLAAAPQMKKPDGVRAWAMQLATRSGHNKATVALANKLARYAWAVAVGERDFLPRAA